MDGYAVRAEDLAKIPVELRIVAEVPDGLAKVRVVLHIPEFDVVVIPAHTGAMRQQLPSRDNPGLAVGRGLGGKRGTILLHGRVKVEFARAR